MRMKIAMTLIVAAGLTLFSAFSAAAEAKRPPNIVVIFAVDMGYAFAVSVRLDYRPPIAKFRALRTTQSVLCYAVATEASTEPKGAVPRRKGIT